MKRKYELAGIKCDGCVAKVRQALMQVPDITEVNVQLDPQGVVLEMSKFIPLEELQTQLSKVGRYTILDPFEHDGTPNIERTRSFSNRHPERHERPFGIDHEPGI